MKLSKKDIAFLDNLDDSFFIFLMWYHFGADVPQWKRITKKEYEKHCGKADGVLTLKKVEKITADLLTGKEYRAVPYYEEGGGILNQISGKQPSGYYYEKCIGHNKVLQLGGDLYEYCKTRECMKWYFKDK